MKTKMILLILLSAFIFVLLPSRVHAEPVGTGFTYQGRLIDNNQPAEGSYDLQFKLFDANSGGNQVGGDVNVGDADVADGYFTVELDFGSVFEGSSRWFEICVRPGDQNDPNSYAVLSPRQVVTPTAYAVYAAATQRSQVAEDANKLDGIDSSGFAASSHSHNSLKAADGNPASALYVDNDGNVGIGTTSPTVKLEIDGISGNDAVARFKAFWNPEIYFDAGGYDADIKLHFRYWWVGEIIEQWQMIYDGSEKDLRFDLAGTGGILTLDQNGRVGIKTNAPVRELEVNGAARITALPTGTGTSLQIEADGDIVKASSSARYKEDIRNLASDADRILRLRPVEFKYKESHQQDVGLIAEEVAEQIPQLVISDEQGRPDAVKYDKVGVYLLGVFKDLKAENESLKQANEDMRRRLDAIESMMAESNRQKGDVK